MYIDLTNGSSSFLEKKGKRKRNMHGFQNYGLGPSSFPVGSLTNATIDTTLTSLVSLGETQQPLHCEFGNSKFIVKN